MPIVRVPHVITLANRSVPTPAGGEVLIAPAAASSTEAGRILSKWLVPAWSLVALGGILLGWYLSWRLNIRQNPQPLVLRDGISIFALFYVAAQAIERLLEPLANLDPQEKALVEQRDQAVATYLAAAAETGTSSAAQAAGPAAANAQGAVEEWRRLRALIGWSAASILGMFLSAYLGLYFFALLLEQGTIPRALDILVTGVVIGAGTKPLHDLIKRIEQAKEDAQDPPETGALR